MKLLRISALVLCGAALLSLAACLFTDRNDGLFLPLALGLCAAGNLLNLLAVRAGKENKT
ncbi:MAG: hypothetical protein ACI4P4_15000 [Faecousia sp.]